MAELLKWSASWKIILELMMGNVVKSEAEALMCVVLSKTEQRALWGIGIVECVML
jgi:hypothetical protein